MALVEQRLWAGYPIGWEGGDFVGSTRLGASRVDAASSPLRFVDRSQRPAEVAHEHLEEGRELVAERGGLPAAGVRRHF